MEVRCYSLLVSYAGGKAFAFGLVFFLLFMLFILSSPLCMCHSSFAPRIRAGTLTFGC